MKKLTTDFNAGRLQRGVRPARLLLLLLLALPGLLLAQQHTISGRVTRSNGEPVPAASVIIKGLNTGTTTDATGTFSLSVSRGAVLVISAIGLGEKEVIVGTQTNIEVKLDPTQTELGEVVVVGYGTQKRRDVTGSVVSVNERALREVPVANLQQALQGRAAGLEIQRTGTGPGAGAQIRIRGTRSISGSNEPLFVVDGIPFEGSLNDINPDDVATIDILKDASATAIYESRGANGVIIITTKRGRSGETRVSYNGYYGISNVANEYPVFDAAEYQAMRNISTWGAGYLPDEVTGIAEGRNTNWQDLMYGTGRRTDHNISVSGGGNGSTFSLGGGYYNEKAVLPGQDFTRYSVRATIDSRIGKKIRVGISTLNQLGITNGSQFVASGTMFPTLAISPLTAPYDANGNIVNLPNGNIDDNNQPTYSPLLLKRNNNNWVDRVRRITTINSLYGELDIVKGLRYRVNVGLRYAQQENQQFQSANTATNPSFFRGFRGNTALVNNGESWGYTVENLLFLNKTIADKHRLDFTGLYSIQESRSHNTQVSKDSITEDFVQFYNLGLSSVTPAPVVTGGESSWALISYMGRVNYAYDDRYLLTLTGRIDGSSRLAKGNKFHEYTAVSAGWNIANESFMNRMSAVSELKLRAGYGQTSNQSINPYASLGLVNNSNGLTAPGNVIRYNYGPTIVTGYQVITLPNPSLQWEYTKMLNVAVDFGFLNNRITGSLEYYHANTDKILYGVSLPPTSGVSGSYQTNIGEMENKGFEFSLSSLNYTSPSGFSWSTDVNLFFNKNKILRLSNQVKEDVASQLFVGYPMSAIYDYNKLGIWQTHEAAEAATYGSVPGQIKLQDYSGPDGRPDGIISPLYDRYVVADGDADLQGGMTHRFAFKGFDLSTVLYARFGGTLISNLHQPIASYLTVMDGKRNGLEVDYWTPTNPSNWFPMPQATISPVSTAWTTLGYYDASFIKIRSINLGYTFSRSVLRRLSAQSMRIYATVDNVAILASPFYNKTGVDPEGTGTGYQGVGGGPGNIRSGGVNNTITVGSSTPPSRTFTVGVNISF